MLSLLALTVAPTAVPVTPVGFRAVAPSVAVRGRQVAIAYASGDDLYFSRSTDGGTSFSAPVWIGTQGKLSSGMRRGPRIVAAGKGWAVSAIYGQKGKGADGDLLAWRSGDDGQTWKGPVPVSDAPAAAREGLHAMAADGQGRLACTWLDLRGSGTEMWVSSSLDGGATWNKNVRAYRSPAGTVCECCHPSLAFGPRGELHLMFRNWLDGARDMYLTTSPGLGRPFGDAVKLGMGTWPLNACPMDGGSLDVAPDGTVQTVWRRQDRVYTCVPGQPEQDLGVGQQPWLATLGKGTVTVFQTTAGLRLAGPKASEASIGDGIRPVVASSGGLAVAAWADASGRVWAVTVR